jgi:hypothetical protein
MGTNPRPISIYFQAIFPVLNRFSEFGAFAKYLTKFSSVL